MNLVNEMVEQVKAGQRTDPRFRVGYNQGQSQESRDRADGERDALRVLSGLEPLRPLNETASPAYVEGWTGAADMALEIGVA